MRKTKNAPVVILWTQYHAMWCPQPQCSPQFKDPCVILRLAPFLAPCIGSHAFLVLNWGNLVWQLQVSINRRFIWSRIATLQEPKMTRPWPRTLERSKTKSMTLKTLYSPVKSFQWTNYEACDDYELSKLAVGCPCVTNKLRHINQSPPGVHMT